MNKAEAEKQIKDYIEAKRILKEMQSSLEEKTMTFYKACETLKAEGFEHKGGLVIKSRTAGQWKYPTKIMKMEDEVKLAKEKFKAKNDPVGGGETIWQVKIKE